MGLGGDLIQVPKLVVAGFVKFTNRFQLQSGCSLTRVSLYLALLSLKLI